MSKLKRLSKLAIAAAVLLTASATCFAQTEPTSQTESNAVVAINKTPRFEARVADSKWTSVTDRDTATNETTAFPAARFMASAKDSVVNSSIPSTSQIRIEPTTTTVLSVPVKSKRITFVPSRGPKLPQ